MLSSLVRRASITFILIVMPAVASSQRPSADQAREILRSRPDLVLQLRQRIVTSGMTPDQIRERLRAEGYPPDLLDAYLPGGTTAPDSLVSSDVFGAVLALGIADSSEVDSLRAPYRRAGARPTSSDSLLLPDVRTSDTVNFALSQGGFRSRRDSVASLQLGLPRGITGAAAIPDSGYAIFGLDVFRRTTSQFDPNLAGPIDASYRIGPGDRLVLVLTGDVEASYNLDVTREGFVVLPQVGQMQVANLTLAQLEDVLYSRLGRVYSGVRRGSGATTHFSVSPARLRSNQIYVLGDVAKPGSYRVSAAGTVLTALYAAGGPTETGSIRQVQVRRGGRTVGELDVYDYLLRGDAGRDSRLENGDVVFVPVHAARVRVTGEVLRPATYEVKHGETLADIIADAGGFSARAARRRVQIERIVPPSARSQPGHDRVVIDIAADADPEETSLAIPLEPGDIVHVFRVADRVRNRITVTGNVWTPGKIGFASGMTISQALRMAGGIKPDTYLGEILVTRLQSDSTAIQMRTSLLDSTGGVTNDFPVLDDDAIRVFSVTEFRPSRFVAIGGAVRKSGRFPYREGMTLRDLVLLAGGLEERAFLQEAEVARLPDDRRLGRLATTTRVPLDSTYLFERGPDGKYLGPPGLPATVPQAPDVPLKPYDNVLILEQPDWNLQRLVMLTGEVRFPGTYALTSKNERLSEVIGRAGGLTNVAYADGVHFFRRKGHLGRIGVDLPRVLRDSRYRDNLILQDGDSIDLPQYSAIVDVRGAVNSPVAVAVVPGKDIDFYIEAAGGLSQKADGSRAYVTQPNGKVESIHRHLLLRDSKPKPGPGSVVIVPERGPSDKHDYLAAFTAVAQLMVGVIGVVSIVKHW